MAAPRKTEIEAWALGVIDRVVKGQPIEDSRVEAKATWLADLPDMARRIAGHANSARGEPILWLIGVDEKSRSVPGVGRRDLAQWWPQVQSSFDSVSPELVSDLNAPYGNVTVVALFFETDRAPYVVTNPAGGKIQYEVPWREATGMRTARREDLLRILAPVARTPTYELLSAHVREVSRVLSANQTITRGYLEIAMYLEAIASSPVFVPFHRCSGSLGFDGGAQTGLFDFAIRPVVALGLPASTTVQATPSELRIEGPGRVVVSADFAANSLAVIRSRAREPIYLALSFPLLQAGSIEVRAWLKPTTPGSDQIASWVPRDGSL